MRVAIAIITVCALFALGACDTIREAGQVAGKLKDAPSKKGLANPDQIKAAQDQEQVAKMDEKLKKIQASGRKPTEAELKELASLALGGKANIPEKPDVKVPADQEISVNLVYSGMQPTDAGKNLDFDFKALWGDYKMTSKQVSMAASKGKSEASLNLDVAKMRVVPKIVSKTHGKYELELKDPAGSLIGKFDIRDSGSQVDLLAKPSKYSTELVYYHPERNLTGYAVYKPGSRKPHMGVIFVGKGWDFVEKNKKADLSKGYVFPEVDLVVLPQAWMEDNDYEMKETCNTLKKGNTKLGGVCYS